MGERSKAAAAEDERDLTAAAESCRFVRDGRKTWTIAYEGRGFRIRHGKGVACLAWFLRYPGEAFHVIDLRAALAFAEKVEGAVESDDPETLSRIEERKRRILEDLRSARRLEPIPANEIDRERARKAVANTIRYTISSIADRHAELARHLEDAICLGSLCAYRPGRTVPWTFCSAGSLPSSNR